MTLAYLELLLTLVENDRLTSALRMQNFIDTTNPLLFSSSAAFTPQHAMWQRLRADFKAAWGVNMYEISDSKKVSVPWAVIVAEHSTLPAVQDALRAYRNAAINKRYAN